jgi:hypothetical protein
MLLAATRGRLYFANQLAPFGLSRNALVMPVPAVGCEPVALDGVVVVGVVFDGIVFVVGVFVVGVFVDGVPVVELLFSGTAGPRVTVPPPVVVVVLVGQFVVLPGEVPVGHVEAEGGVCVCVVAGDVGCCVC